MLETCLENVRKTVPLVHNITNYVTVNDVANILLACGGSPIMSDEPDDVEDITSICGGLNINLGTLNKRSIEGMFRAGKKAQELSLIHISAVKGGSRLSTAEANALIDELLQLENPYNCPHGRPTIVTMTKYELEKKFKRVL